MVRPVAPPSQALPLVRARLVAALRNDPEPPRYLEETADRIFYERGYPLGRYRRGIILSFDPGTIALAVKDGEIEIAYRAQHREWTRVALLIFGAVVLGFATGSVFAGAMAAPLFLLVFVGLESLNFWRFRNWLKTEAEAAAQAFPAASADGTV